MRVADLWAPLARSVGPVVRTVAADEPQSGLGYFLFASVWVRAFGGELGVLRAASAVASTLAVLLVHRLARALFGVADVALAAAALVALSPLHLRYAQEARPYALWSAALVIAALALVRARTRGTPGAAFGYAVALAAALWVQLLTVLVLPGFAALGRRGDGDPAAARTTARLRVATMAALATSAAWAPVCWRARTRIAAVTAWAAAPTSLRGLVHGWLGVVTAVFFRPWGEGGFLPSAPQSFAANSAWSISGILVAAVVALGLRAVGTGTAAPVRRFVPLFALGPWALLAAIDVVFGGQRSTVARYLVPLWIGAPLAVAWFTAAPDAGSRRRALLAALLALAAATALRARSAEVWWDTDASRMHGVAAAARTIAAADHPIVVTDVWPLRVLELARQLPATTDLRLGARPPRGVVDWDRVLLFDPSDALRAATVTAAGPTHTLAPVPGASLLWRLARATS